MATSEVPEHIRSDNGPEFTAAVLREWLGKVGVKTLFLEPGSPWENGYVESFNSKLRDELLDREIFDSLPEAKVLIERWRRHYNQVRPHSSLGYRLQVPETIVSCASAEPQRRQKPHEDSGVPLAVEGASVQTPFMSPISALGVFGPVVGSAAGNVPGHVDADILASSTRRIRLC